MPHVRRQLREAVAEALTGLATTGPRVYQSRVYPLQGGELPGLLVYAQEETAEALTIHQPPIIERRVELRIEGIAAAAADLDDALDQMAQEIETALAGGVWIGAQSIDLMYGGCSIEFDGEAARPHGVISLRYVASIASAANTPDVFS
jgi:hypothetical protein